MRNVEIEIFMIAKTQPVIMETRNWLDHIGATEYEIPNMHTITGPDMVVGHAAKRCYKSFQKSLNPNLTRVRKNWTEYLSNLLASGHGCYDSETDVLTANGWKNWSQVVEDDLLATLNEDHVIEYHKPIKLLRAEYSGPMYHVDSQAVNLLVTPNHNMYVCPTTTKDGRRKKEYRLIQARDLGHVSHAYVKTGSWLGTGVGDLDDDVLWLLGFAIGDANVSRGRLSFHLHRKRKIDALMRRSPWDVHQKEDWFTVNPPKEFRKLFDEIYDASGRKVIPQRILMECSSEQLANLFDGMMESDGCKAGTAKIYDTTSPELAGQFQQLLLHIGKCGNISQAKCYAERTNGSFGTKPLHRAYVVSRCDRPEVNKFNGSKGKTSWIDDWKGTVFCAEVPNHTLFVRRAGKPVWCGNSVLEHASYTFAIENVSRVFTGEMNRHRAGVAVSEGSMRYIRYTDMPCWLPFSIRPADWWLDSYIDMETEAILADIDRRVTELASCNKTFSTNVRFPIPRTVDAREIERERKRQRSRDIFAKSYAADEKTYQEMETIWADELAPESGFHDKKQITSMMRRTIPMGIATGGVWTLNIRALRHVLALRASEAAEEEICHVFTRIGKRIVEEEPRLFGDFSMTPEGYWVPKYPKV